MHGDEMNVYREMLDAAGLPHESTGDCAITLARPLPAERIPGFKEGLVSIQDASAQRAALFLDPHDRARVLDACAAPGGKTAHHTRGRARPRNGCRQRCGATRTCSGEPRAARIVRAARMRGRVRAGNVVGRSRLSAHTG